jgi:nitrogen fixation protein FixH
MSWSTKITILYLSFVALILTLVFKSFGNKTDLEYKDYYTRELHFQNQIDASENFTKLFKTVNLKVTANKVQINFPEELIVKKLSGTIYFLRPSDASSDYSASLELNQHGVQTIHHPFKKGLYKVQLSFNDGNKDYYKEWQVTFN